MTMFQLNPTGDCAFKIGTNEWHSTQSSPEYLAWLDEGNTPEPAPEPPSPPVLTTEQKLNAAGLTVAELKELFGLT